MSIGKKNKDHLKAHAGVTEVTPVSPTKTDDPLRFWTQHPNENTLVDLHPWAEGEFQNPGRGGNKWAGPFTGRPRLIRELAPAIEARLALLGKASSRGYLNSLRAWWRLFDSLESASSERLHSVAQLNELHEVTAHARNLTTRQFRDFIRLANDTRRAMKLPPLLWRIPQPAEPVRKLIPDDQARELKTALKQDWEQVRKTWARNDLIRAEAERRLAGEPAEDLGEDRERLLKNWQYFQAIQQQTGAVVPTGAQLLGQYRDYRPLTRQGLDRTLMRALAFPRFGEAEIAFHLALMNSGWNPSTLANLDATSPLLITDHPKDPAQIVLSTDADDLNDQGGGEEEKTIAADKPRALGKTQFCTALKKHKAGAPFIVAEYLKRAAPLRSVVKTKYEQASAELTRLQASGVDHKIIAKQTQRVQELRKQSTSVWLYLSNRNGIQRLNPGALPVSGSKKSAYLPRLLTRLNSVRLVQGKAAIAPVTPGDFRDIYARWVYKTTNGSILAVMLALGHSSLASTGRYMDNNLFSAENDDQVRGFLTHLFDELGRGRMDLTILAQLVRHGPLTAEMQSRLVEYRKLMRSRSGVGCADPRHPPASVAPDHAEGRLCGPQRCLKDCPHARFLPESLDGIAMRVEELSMMSDQLPRETWLRGGFDEELQAGEYLLKTLYPPDRVLAARETWQQRIATGDHLIPGLGRITTEEAS